jgi:uncharacterized protein
MPEYLAPGVYLEETSFRSKSIEGVSTTTTGFVGPTRYGPISIEPDIITSIGEFERIYGDKNQLEFDGAGKMHNFMWHAARAFFEEGGKRLYVARVFTPKGEKDDGCARASLPEKGGVKSIEIKARFPGKAGNMRVRLDLVWSQNILKREKKPKTENEYENIVSGLYPRDVVWVGDITSPITSPPEGQLFVSDFDKEKQAWVFKPSAGSDTALEDLHPELGVALRVLTVNLTVLPDDPNALSSVWTGLPLDPGHQQSGSPDSISEKFAEDTKSLLDRRTLPIAITLKSGGGTSWAGIDVLKVLFQIDPEDIAVPGTAKTKTVLLANGNDGIRPTADEYGGGADEKDNKTGLVAFEDIDDISIVAAPGSTFKYNNVYKDNASTIISHLISHAERMRYRIAVLDSGDNQTISQVREMRARYDSKHAALYYPWVRVLDPVTRNEINLPPSGFVAGIYARNDINRAVYKAPANEVVNLALGFEKVLNKSQQEVLNPEGINCFRFFEGRGNRLWGARTISSDPEWKYVNLRRYFAYLEHSIDKGTQWAVFEPNGDALWANVRRTIEDFLLNEWMNGALLGDKPEKAYFVRCDRSTMTQNDLDNGRLICLIGVAPLRPAEFVIFRIGQWTADRRS